MSHELPTPAAPAPLGPSGRWGGDLLGMARGLARAHPWRYMPTHHRTAAQPTRSRGSARRRDAIRLAAVVLAVVALILTSSALNWVSRVSAADEIPAPKKAVIVSGPVHSLTDRYKDYARAIADAAEAQGMDVRRIFHPNATKARVKKHANGADLFVYVGHGNGWPSPYGPFQEDTKNGLGLNPDDPAKRTTSNVVYKGADWLRANIELAPNAVVILSHLSYASGNASSGMPIPTRDVAVQRVDNFANGFLSIGARVVWALGWQPGADVVDALYEEDATMDAVFMTRYRSGVNPLNGWIGHDPGYYASARIPGATVHIDPDPGYGYLRGITGDLDFTTTEWRDAAALPADSSRRSSATSAPARPPSRWPRPIRASRSSRPTATASATPSRSRTGSPRTPSWRWSSRRTATSCARPPPGPWRARAASPGTGVAMTASSWAKARSRSSSRRPIAPATG